MLRWLRLTLWPFLVQFGPSLVVAAAVLAVLLVNERDRLGYVKALAWPTVVLIGLFALRDVLRERLGNLRRASAFGGEFEFFERHKVDLEQGIAEEVVNALDSMKPAAMKEAQTTEGHSDISAFEESSEENEESRREAIERAVNLSVEYGFYVARKSNGKMPPKIDILWEGDKPFVRGTTHYSLEDLTGPDWVRAGSENLRKRAEDEVRKLERESLKPFVNMVERYVINQQLAEAKKRLARIDPTRRSCSSSLRLVTCRSITMTEPNRNRPGRE
jgi:hypothetical protein